MKARISVAAALAMLPVVAQAAWFCGSDVAEFANKRTTSALSDVYLSDRHIIREGQELEMVKGRVDDYKAKVIEMKEWAGALADSCLRDAYRAALKGHEAIVDEDYRAIEFMKTPQPFAPNS